nr:immunoglobulin light chain junction region [Macaca mulatta]
DYYCQVYNDSDVLF